MSEQMEQVIERIRTPSTWLRILFMLGFGVILYLVGMVLLILTVAQALFSIFTGSDNRNLRRLGAALADYVCQLLRFITYNSDERPFPFAPFPEVDPEVGPEPGPEFDPDLEARPTKSTMKNQSEPATGKPAKNRSRPRTRKKPTGAADTMDGPGR